MTTKFKPGDVCWHVTQGVVKLEESGASTKPLRDRFGDLYTEDGKHHSTDPFPSLYDLPTARKMGFPVPKERLRVEVRVTWERDPVSAAVYPDGTSEWQSLVGRTGVLVFTEDEGGSK